MDYDHREIEGKWRECWERQDLYATGKPGKRRVYCLDMFPYPSGTVLHVGHTLGFVASDIYARFKRMQGYSVLHPMGWDAFGLPIEQSAIQKGEHPRAVVDRNCAEFKNAMRMLDLS